MICIIAGNYLEAERYARAQNLEPNEWFFPNSELELLSRSNFHVIVTGTAGMNTPESYFNRIYSLARTRGKIGRH